MISKKRASTRIYLDEALKERNIDVINEMVELYKTADFPNKVKIMEIFWDRLFPKARPEDHEGNPGIDGGVVVVRSDEEVANILNTARIKQNGG